MIKIESTGIGADPELFLSRGGKIISSIGLVGGTKKKPLELDARGYYVQEDNVLTEFNIPPASSELEFSENINTGLHLVRIKLGPDYELIAKASHEMDKDELKDPKAMAFGCDSDINAWTGDEHVAEAPESTLRTAGGHFHFGYKNPSKELNTKLARSFDIHHGLASVILDSDTKRRQIYGGAGHFRHKPYGLEYRTLSSFWVNDSILSRWVYRQALVAAKFVEDGLADKLDVFDGHDIITAINFSDKQLAQLLIAKYNVKLP